MRLGARWPTSLLGALALCVVPLACGSDDAPVAGTSSGGDAGVIPIEDIDLAVYPLRQYTGFDGTHDFQVPYSVFRAKEDLTLTASDPDAVEITPATYASAKEDGRYFLVKAKKAGDITLTAKSRGKTVSSTLSVADYAAARYAAGQERYLNEGTDGQPACASCHQKPDGPDHSPAAISAASDDAVKAVIRTGIDLSNSPITKTDHRWKVEGATLDGLVTYLRALPPHGYSAAAQSFRSQTWPSDAMRHVRLHDGAPAGDFVQHARSVLASHRAWIGTVDPDAGLALVKHRVDALGLRHVRFAQVERGVPVLGAELMAHYDRQGALRTLDSTLATDLAALDLAPRIGPADAERVALSAYVTRFGGDPARARFGFAAWGQTETTPQLGIHVRHGERRLVYVVGLCSDAGRPLRLRARVDAHTGALVEIYDDAKTVQATSKGVFGEARAIQVEKGSTAYALQDTTRGKGILTYTAGEDQDLPGTQITSTDLNGSWDQDVPNGKGSAVDAHFFAGVVYDYYKTTFERLGIDGKDGAIKSSVHYGIKYDNAFWEGRQMAYGDGDLYGPFAGAVDVVAHELTHGVTQSESELEYAFQAGAINEGISDIFGAIVEHGLLPDETNNWFIGEKIERTEGLPLRNMSDPAHAESPQPDHMQEYLDLTLDQDNGGVHLNSGIVNNAAYLMAVGGVHRLSKIDVPGGIGWEKLATLWYRVNTEYLMRQSEFTDAAQATHDAAVDLDFTAAEQHTIECAWHAVGVLPGDCNSGATVSAEGDAGEATSSSSGVVGQGNNADGADFSKTNSACQAAFAPASAPWLFGALALLAGRRRKSRAPHTEIRS